jgi:hypothetical protein
VTPKELHQNLSNFTCSDENAYLHRFAANIPVTLCRETPGGFPLKVAYSEGVKYLVEHGQCRWLLDMIATEIQKPAKDPKYWETHFWRLEKKGGGAILRCIYDTDEKSLDEPLVVKRIGFTDFPFELEGKQPFTLYAGATQRGSDKLMLIFLPSEY